MSDTKSKQRQILRTLDSSNTPLTAAQVADKAHLNRQETIDILRELHQKDVVVLEESGGYQFENPLVTHSSLPKMTRGVMWVIYQQGKSPFTILNLAELIGKEYAATQKHISLLKQADLLEKKDRTHYQISKEGIRYAKLLPILTDVFSPTAAPGQPAKPNTAHTKDKPVKAKQANQEVTEMVETLVQEDSSGKEVPISKATPVVFTELDKELAELQPKPLRDVPAKLHIIQNLRDRLPKTGQVNAHLGELELFLIQMAS